MQEQVMTGAFEDETYRAVVVGRTPDNADATMIITRRAGRVWITLAASIRCTIVLAGPLPAEVVTKLREAARLS